MRTILVTALILLGACRSAFATDGAKLFDSLRQKILSVKDYTAEVKMKISVKYMRIPQLSGTLYFKSPDKMRLERHGGLSILPRKNINLTLSNLIPTGKVTVIEAGSAVVEGKTVTVLKVIPEDEQSEIILCKLWVDEKNLTVLRSETTTRGDGTLKMELQYGRYTNYALPDKVLLTLDVKDFKMPKGVTMDYVPTDEDKTAKGVKEKKGTIQITYLNYTINKGISDNLFKPGAE